MGISNRTEANVTERKQCDTVLEKLSKIIRDILEEPTLTIRPESRLGDDIGADSLDIAEIVIDSEHKFSILIPDNIVETWMTVGDAVEWIETNADPKNYRGVTCQK
jgi:acyl carrier protein